MAPVRRTRAALPTAVTFRSPGRFRAWLSRHHRSATELSVRLFKKHAAHQGLTYPQALDEALSFGWIDGVRRPFDAESFTVRFTPRRPKSVWSRINVAHVQRLIDTQRMTKAGMAAFEARQADRTGVYSFEQGDLLFPKALVERFEANREAWTYFQSKPPGYRRLCTSWVMSAKREETKLRRLDVLIASSARHRVIPPLAAPGRRS